MCKLYISNESQTKEKLTIKSVIERAIRANKTFNLEIRENYNYWNSLHKTTQDELLRAFKRNDINIVMCV